MERRKAYGLGKRRYAESVSPVLSRRSWCLKSQSDTFVQIQEI
jgi:hypothetical protein